jgi:hypothetical protein
MLPDFFHQGFAIIALQIKRFSYFQRRIAKYRFESYFVGRVFH